MVHTVSVPFRTGFYIVKKIFTNLQFNKYEMTKNVMKIVMIYQQSKQAYASLYL